MSGINNSIMFNTNFCSAKRQANLVKGFGNIVPLNLNSQGCKYFGVDSSNNIFANLIRHVSLIKIMERNKGIKAKFMNKSFVDIEDAASLAKNKSRIWEGCKLIGKESSILVPDVANLRAAGAARMNIYSASLFDDVCHTIGLVVDNNTNTLYVLDSFGNKEEKVREYHTKIAELFDGKSYVSKNEDNSPKPFSRIIFNTKKQQTFNEYTCNNWTFANIEALTKALKRGVIINNERDLDKYLPNNINTILNEQMNYVIKYKDFIESVL